ncbi:MAG TPA: hypothetical protein VNI01_04480 [Elusimicrobiota bacterium]|jgi:hypothetical protein|nr:hypothetical protein [Elusimicrobiota bacterium]
MATTKAKGRKRAVRKPAARKPAARKPTARKLPARLSAKEVLAEIDAWAASQVSQVDRNRAQDLWLILTAMRGPDSEDERVKAETTCVLRAAALPRLAKAGGALVGLADRAALQRLTRYHEDTWDVHFGRHVRLAAKALLELVV